MTNVVDLNWNVKALLAIPPQTLTATTTGSAMYVGDITGPYNIQVDVGAVSGTTPTLIVSLTESATSGGTYTAVPDSTTATINTANTITAKLVRQSTLPYVKAVATIAGTSPSFIADVVILGQKGKAGTSGGFSNDPSS